MPLTYTAGLSRADVENGFTDRFGNVWGAGDWAYATRLQAATLLGSLWDKKYNGWSKTNGDGASWFLSHFGGLGYDIGYGLERIDGKRNEAVVSQMDHTNFFYGSDKECSSSLSTSCLGHVGGLQNYKQDLSALNGDTNAWETAYFSESGIAGWIHNGHGASASSPYPNIAHKDDLYTDYGSLLVRAAAPILPVNTPPSISILAFGLLSLLLRRRRQTHQ